MAASPEPVFFATPEALRVWFQANHETEDELIVGFHRTGTGVPSITWPEAVDEALCVGWIDGVRRRLDERRYTVRFTPRRPGSNWSAVNVARVEALTAEGRMRPAGLRAFEARIAAGTAVYSYEQRYDARLDEEMEREFRADGAAWAFFQGQPPGYRASALHWVMSARREDTRRRRLRTLVDDSRAGERIALLRRSRRG